MGGKGFHDVKVHSHNVQAASDALKLNGTDVLGSKVLVFLGDVKDSEKGQPEPDHDVDYRRYDDDDDPVEQVQTDERPVEAQEDVSSLGEHDDDAWSWNSPVAPDIQYLQEIEQINSTRQSFAGAARDSDTSDTDDDDDGQPSTALPPKRPPPPASLRPKTANPADAHAEDHHDSAKADSSAPYADHDAIHSLTHSLILLVHHDPSPRGQCLLLKPHPHPHPIPSRWSAPCRPCAPQALQADLRRPRRNQLRSKIRH